MDLKQSRVTRTNVIAHRRRLRLTYETSRIKMARINDPTWDMNDRRFKRTLTRFERVRERVHGFPKVLKESSTIVRFRIDRINQLRLRSFDRIVGEPRSRVLYRRIFMLDRNASVLLFGLRRESPFKVSRDSRRARIVNSLARAREVRPGLEIFVQPALFVTARRQNHAPHRQRPSGRLPCFPHDARIGRRRKNPLPL